MDVCGDFIVVHVTGQTEGEGRGDYALHQQLNCFFCLLGQGVRERALDEELETFLSKPTLPLMSCVTRAHDSNYSLP